LQEAESGWQDWSSENRTGLLELDATTGLMQYMVRTGVVPEGLDRLLKLGCMPKATRFAPSPWSVLVNDFCKPASYGMINSEKNLTKSHVDLIREWWVKTVPASEDDIKVTARWLVHRLNQCLPPRVMQVQGGPGASGPLVIMERLEWLEVRRILSTFEAQLTHPHLPVDALQSGKVFGLVGLILDQLESREAPPDMTSPLARWRLDVGLAAREPDNEDATLSPSRPRL
jgi:hypothetical protein